MQSYKKFGFNDFFLATGYLGEQIQDFVKSMGRDLNFSVDQTTGYHVVRVVDPNTGEVVRQLPSKELLEIARSMANLQNVLVSQKA
jgi:flagellar protein FlaG